MSPEKAKMSKRTDLIILSPGWGVLLNIIHKLRTSPITEARWPEPCDLFSGSWCFNLGQIYEPALLFCCLCQGKEYLLFFSLVFLLVFSLDWNRIPLLSNLCQWVPRDITAWRCPRVTPWKIETSPISPPLQMERRGSLIVISAPQTWGDQTPPCFLGGFCWQGNNEINCRLANKNQTLIWLCHAVWANRVGITS